jgi:hypothetical protein
VAENVAAQQEAVGEAQPDLETPGKEGPVSADVAAENPEEQIKDELKVFVEFNPSPAPADGKSPPTTDVRGMIII